MAKTCKACGKPAAVLAAMDCAGCGGTFRACVPCNGMQTSTGQPWLVKFMTLHRVACTGSRSLTN